jgi:hypothetical protein
MTPKEKAEELFEKFLKTDKVDDYSFVGNKVAKQCALIAVTEIIKSRPVIPSPIACDDITDCFVQAKEYWQQVKIEIEKL